MQRRWSKALSGLWERRAQPAARIILEDALAAAEEAVGQQLELDIQTITESLHAARHTGEKLEILAHDTTGRPVILEIYPDSNDDGDCIHICVRYPRHRLFQFVGEPA